MADDLHRAAGRPRRPAEEHRRDEDDRGEDRPDVEIGVCRPGRGHDRDELEDTGPDCLLTLRDAFGPELDDQYERPQGEESDVEAELLVSDQRPRIRADEGAVEQGEVRAGERHECGDRPLRGCAESFGSAGLGGETTRRQRRERMSDRLEEAHPFVEARPGERGQDADHRDREPDVERPEPARRVPNPGRHLLELGARELVLEQLPAAHPQPRQDGEGEDDDPHAAEPLRQLSPDQQRVR
jgi:hypothetical protein